MATDHDDKAVVINNLRYTMPHIMLEPDYGDTVIQVFARAVYSFWFFNEANKISSEDENMMFAVRNGKIYSDRFWLNIKNKKYLVKSEPHELTRVWFCEELKCYILESDIKARRYSYIGEFVKWSDMQEVARCSLKSI